MIKISYLHIVLVLFFLGCESEEIPVHIDSLGEIKVRQIDLGENYCYQKYYNLDSDFVVSENLITEWDLRFANFSSTIMLNSAKYMRVVAFDPLTFSTLDDLINNATWSYDDPTGDMSMLAFNNGGQTLSKNHFLVDKGYNCNDEHIGYSIFRIIDYTDSEYIVQSIDINDDGSWTYNGVLEIQKTPNNNYMYFSFTTNNTLNIVNPDWDLCFSQYTEFNVFPPGGNTNSEPLPTYRVVGVLQNLHVSVAVDTTNNFSDITIQDVINNYDFTYNFNGIGYEWKSYNLQSGLYSIDSPVYIIKTSDLDYYKLLFLDFYNDEGEKGAPMFQIEKI